MHLIDEPGHANNQFVMANPEQGILPTRFGANWPNAVQNEIANVITDAGFELDKSKHTQLRDAIGQIIQNYLADYDFGISKVDFVEAAYDFANDVQDGDAVTSVWANNEMTHKLYVKSTAHEYDYSLYDWEGSNNNTKVDRTRYDYGYVGIADVSNNKIWLRDFPAQLTPQNFEPNKLVYNDTTPGQLTTNRLPSHSIWQSLVGFTDADGHFIPSNGNRPRTWVKKSEHFFTILVEENNRDITEDIQLALMKYDNVRVEIATDVTAIITGQIVLTGHRLTLYTYSGATISCRTKIKESDYAHNDWYRSDTFYMAYDSELKIQGSGTVSHDSNIAYSERHVYGKGLINGGHYDSGNRIFAWAKVVIRSCLVHLDGVGQNFSLHLAGSQIQRHASAPTEFVDLIWKGGWGHLGNSANVHYGGLTLGAGVYLGVPGLGYWLNSDITGARAEIG